MLRSRPDISIKPADKHSASVVMSRHDYLARVMSHLQNMDFYCKLDKDPTKLYAEEITSTLQEMTDQKTINKETFHY